jgi:hypothetical protein
MMLSALILPILMAEPAHAWRHLQHVWDHNSDFPFEWWMSDSFEDSWSDTESTELDVLNEAWSHWVNQAPCAEITTEYQGVRTGHNAGYTNDAINTTYFDDPADQLGAGVLGATLTLPSGIMAFTLAGDTYTYAFDSDIIFNDDVVWVSDDQIRAGACSGGHSLEGVATHEMGHGFGMGHSCEEGEACSELDLRYATMYWSGGPCSENQSELKSDDVEGITALYGPYAAFSSDSKRNGGVPLEVCFDVEMDENNEDLQITWSYGDGTIEENNDTSVCHVYETAGQHTVSMSVTGTAEECGEWSSTQRELAFVTVCEPPKPAKDFDGMFTYEDVEGTLIQMINQVDTSVYGCIERIRWDVFKVGEDTPMQSISAWSPKIDFQEAGEYRVVLNVGAPGDLFSAEELLVEVGGGAGCSTAPASGGLAGLLLGLFGLLYRRRD